MRISEAAKKTGLSASNIRFYEKKKLLVAGREQQNEYRDYTDQDIECLKRIVVLRKAGLSIEEIRDIFDGKADVKTVLGEQQQKLQSQLQDLQGSLELCASLEREGDLLHMDADRYLDYVKEQETKGTRFAEFRDTVSEFAEFIDNATLFHTLDPVLGRYSYLGKYLWLAVLLVFAMVLIFEVATRRSGIAVALLIGLWFLAMFCDYMRWRRRKHDSFD